MSELVGWVIADDELLRRAQDVLFGPDSERYGRGPQRPPAERVLRAGLYSAWECARKAMTEVDAAQMNLDRHSAVLRGAREEIEAILAMLPEPEPAKDAA